MQHNYGIKNPIPSSTNTRMHWPYIPLYQQLPPLLVLAQVCQLGLCLVIDCGKGSGATVIMVSHYEAWKHQHLVPTVNNNPPHLMYSHKAVGSLSEMPCSEGQAGRFTPTNTSVHELFLQNQNTKASTSEFHVFQETFSLMFLFYLKH